MVDPVYPSELPRPIKIGRTMSHVDPMIRTPMSTGRAKQRRRYESVPTMIPVQFVFKDPRKVVYFESWYNGVLGDGVKWFTMPIKLPAGMGPWRCRFTGIYEGPTLIGHDIWSINANLEIYERPIVSGDWALYYPEALLYPDVIDLAINVEWPESQYQTYMGAYDFAATQEWPEA